MAEHKKQIYDEVALSMRNVVKTFDGFNALTHVNLEVKKR
jgi:ABC-type sugar transport system ATPase subunit